MNRVRLLVMVAVLIPLLVIAGYIFLYDSASVAGSSGSQFTGFTVGGKTFKFTYVATNQSMLQKGLMNTKVNDDTTMLFVFATPGYYSFWMFGVNSSLDIMWLQTAAGSDAGKFVYLAREAPPCHVAALCTTYQPNAEANYVIEAKGGFAAANGIAVGTTVSLK